MKVIILAAGRGSRLGERTADRPKCMCVLAGRTLLERCLESIEKAGFDRKDIGIVTGYKSEMFKESGVSYFHNPDWEQTNMFISLTMAGEWLKREPCIVCYSDIVFSSQAVQSLADCQEPLALTYYTGFWELWEARMGDPLSDLETFRLKDGGKYLSEIGRKPESREEIEGQYMGLILFTPESWGWACETIKRPLPKSVAKLDMTTLLEGMIEDGHPVRAIPTDELWLECDTQQDIEAYERLYRDALL